MIGWGVQGPRSIGPLRDQIVAAFCSVPKVADSDLLKPVDPSSCADWESYREKRDQIAAPLRGKNWDELDHEQRSECLQNQSYLSPAAFRYFLPAFLLSSLEDEDFAWSTVVRVSPNFCEIHHGGRDAALDARIADLDAAQYRAVVTFLTWLADGPNRFAVRYRAIECLKWGWTREGVDEARIRSFYQRVHSYRRPVIGDEPREMLARLVEDAFAETPYPGDETIVGHHCEECCEIGVEFIGADWRSVDPDFLRYYHAAPSLFSPEAFRYFFPAYVLCDLAGNSAFTSSGSFHLSYGVEPGHEAHERSLARWKIFSDRERCALIAYLELAWDDGKSFEAENLRIALDSYWLPSVSR